MLCVAIASAFAQRGLRARRRARARARRRARARARRRDRERDRHRDRDRDRTSRSSSSSRPTSRRPRSAPRRARASSGSAIASRCSSPRSTCPTSRSTCASRVDLGARVRGQAQAVAGHRRTPTARTSASGSSRSTRGSVGELHVPPLAVTFTANGQGRTDRVPMPCRVQRHRRARRHRRRSQARARQRAAHAAARAATGSGLWSAAAWHAWSRARSAFFIIRSGGAGACGRSSARSSRRTPTPRRIDMTSERALERLLAIERSGVLDRDDERKLGYTQMVEVIREYLGARYRIATLRSDELRAAATAREGRARPRARARRGVARALRHRQVRRLPRDGRRCAIACSSGTLACHLDDARTRQLRRAGSLPGGIMSDDDDTTAPKRKLTPERVASRCGRGR